ncbi:MAG TPA: DsrE family protein [Bacteroidota bacterium]|nr:DsrE family protein [Bacteroidota bacterium]
MKATRVTFLVVAFSISPVASSAAFAQEYAALKGVKSTKVVFDVRTGIPKVAALQLKLIRQTNKDLIAEKKAPVTNVVFIGQSVKLVSSSREGFAPEDLPLLDEIAEAVRDLSRDGIGLEFCLFAAKIHKVEPASVLPEITKVENGYISIIGYQAQGYTLVPVY